MVNKQIMIMVVVVAAVGAYVNFGLEEYGEYNCGCLLASPVPDECVCLNRIGEKVDNCTPTCNLTGLRQHQKWTR